MFFINKLLVLLLAVVLFLVGFFIGTWSSQPTAINNNTPEILFSMNVKTNDEKNNTQQSSSYEPKCLRLFKRLRHPNTSLIFNPALKQPPENMLDEFTQHGEMPITKWFYFNDVYSDSKGDDDSAEKKRVITRKQIEDLLKMVRNNEPLGYDDKVEF